MGVRELAIALWVQLPIQTPLIVNRSRDSILAYRGTSGHFRLNKYLAPVLLWSKVSRQTSVSFSVTFSSFSVIIIHRNGTYFCYGSIIN
jgi:hypothetical protein